MLFHCQSFFYYIFFSVFLISKVNLFSLFLSKERNQHKLQPLTEKELKTVVRLLEDHKQFDHYFSNILHPRAVGTKFHQNVEEFITNELALMGWNVEFDEFTEKTPLGKLQFKNIISTHNSDSHRYLILACHYDSKYSESEEFMGATDAAVPCAMLLCIANAFNNYLQNNYTNSVALKLIFFDGAEPLKSWTTDDSLYGSRHLAHDWDITSYFKGGTFANQLDRIDLMLLLDILGAENPKFYSYIPATYSWYQGLVEAEDKLHQCNFLENYSERYFHDKSTDVQIGDDHLPFLKKDVPVIHIIPVDFPEEWHTSEDTRNIINLPTIVNLMKIVSVFVSEYMGMFHEVESYS